MDCPCQSNKSYDECCRPLHDGRRLAETPEELMRSRYSAFVKGELEYLEETHHPETRRPVEAWPVEWLGLKVVSAEGDTVAFEASYRRDGQDHCHRETSRFLREAERWYYYDGRPTPVRRESPRVGRNDPCPCGSGRKYKKCCGGT